MKFADIPQFPRAYYSVHVSFDYLEHCLNQWDRPETGSPLMLNPEFQRGHVWSKFQQIAYVEYMFKGGNTGGDIYFNCSSWGKGYDTPIYCVDGLQRITAIRKFMNNELAIFDGYTISDFEDRPRLINNRFTFNMLNIKSKKELLKIYLDFNSGGTIHSEYELERIKQLIEDTPENETL